MRTKYKKQTQINFAITGILFLIFAIFTLLVKKVDVKPIGPKQSLVGMASLNEFIFELFGVNLLWYNITDWRFEKILLRGL